MISWNPQTHIFISWYNERNRVERCYSYLNPIIAPSINVKKVLRMYWIHIDNRKPTYKDPHIEQGKLYCVWPESHLTF